MGTTPGLLYTGPLTTGSITVVSDSTLNSDALSGMRFTTGAWLNQYQSVGLDGSFFELPRKTSHQRFQSSGDPMLGPLFVDPAANQLNLIVDSIPPAVPGSLGIASATSTITSSEQLWGSEVNFRIQSYSIVSDRTDLLVGFRYLSFDESLSVTSVSTTTATGDTVTQLDSFGVHNQFYGPQIGFQSDFNRGPWFMNVRTLLALGNMHQVVDINGSTTFVSIGVPTTQPGGVLAQPTNMGHHARDEFALVPELKLNFGYQVTQHIRAFIGYDLLYVSSMARLGNNMDRNVNTQIPSVLGFTPGSPAIYPAFNFSDTRFWAQGINVGVEVRLLGTPEIMGTGSGNVGRHSVAAIPS